MRAQPIRTGTSSGTRANKPHPSREFMIFRFRSPLKYPSQTDATPTLIGDKLLSQCIRAQMRSIYSTDYVNNVEAKKKLQQEQALRPATATPDSVKQEFPLFQYNHPFTYESLNISPTRFGSSQRYMRKARGILPNL